MSYSKIRYVAPEPTHSSDGKTWDFWIDPLGQEIRVDDFIAVSTISGRSPQLVIAQVDRINRMNSSDEVIGGEKRTYVGPPQPPQDAAQIFYKDWLEERKRDHNWAMVYRPDASIRARPLMRGWSGVPRNRKLVTYFIMNNIVRIDAGNIPKEWLFNV